MTDPGQPAQPYGNAGSYNQQDSAPGGYPYQPGGGETQPSPYDAPPPAKKAGAGKVVGIVAGVLVALLVVCGVLFLIVRTVNKTNTLNAKVNDCIHTDGSLDSVSAQQVKNTKIVKCDAADATYKVVGIVGDKTETQFEVDEKICDTYPSAKSAMWQGADGKAGKVLCLAPVKS